MNGKANALTRQSGDLPSDEDERVLQQSRVILKPENFLEVHAPNIPFHSVLDESISEPSLSEIDENDFQQLKSEVLHSESLSFLGQDEISSDENDLVNLDELWNLAYANLDDPMYKVMNSL